MILRLLGRRKKRRSLLPYLLLGVSAIAAGGWAYREVRIRLMQPEAILVLGGHESREHFAAQLAAQHPHLPVWVSSGSPEGYARRIFAKAGVTGARLHLDYTAQDTVTNFTSLVPQLQQHQIQSVYLVTSDNHMRRARLVGEIILGSQGIMVKPVAVPSHFSQEPVEKSLRDGARALFWVATGSTGEGFPLQNFLSINKD